MSASDALALRQIRAALLQSGGRQKLDLILNAPNPRALVQSLPAQELYLALLDIGLDDCAEIVAHASNEQFKFFIDASCWPRRDAPPDPRKIMRWLTLARDGGGATDQGMRRFHMKLASLDTELFSLLMRRELKVHDLTENEFPEYGDDVPTWTTPDRRYMIEFHEEGAPYAILKRLLDDLVAQNAFHVSRMLEALRWELPSELEETARRFRDGRLRDAGVPDLDEALAFVARPMRKKVKAGEAGTTADTETKLPTDNSGAMSAEPLPAQTSAITLPFGTPPMLERAMQRLDDADRAHAEEAIVYAANAALVGWQIQLDDPSELRPALTNARSLLSLGLELLSHGDEAVAAQLLINEPVRAIFQAAMGELYRLQTRGRAVAQASRLPQATRATLLGPPYAALIDALHGTPPLIDGVRMHSSGPHAPESRAELQRAELLLDEAATLPALLAANGLTMEKLGAAIESAGVAASALRASDVFRQLVICDLRRADFSLADQREHGSPSPDGFVQQLDIRLKQGTDSLQSGPERAAGGRVADHLRAMLLA